MGALDRIFQEASRDLVPLTVHFDLTYRCHQSCLHCYLPGDWRRGRGGGAELDTARIRAILDQLAAAGTFFLNFSGGEVFLRSDLLGILAHARKLNFSLSLMTSGTWGLEGDTLRALAAIRVETLFLSLHSLEAAQHDRVTGLPGSWARVMQTIEECQVLGLPLVLNSQILSFNYRGLPALKSFAAKHNIPLRAGDDLSPRWDGRRHSRGLALKPGEQEWLRRQVGDAADDGMTSGLPPARKSHGGGCHAGLRSCYVTPAGEVWPCLEIPWPCGRLTEGEDFRALWKSSPILNRLRTLIVKDQELAEPFCDYLRSQEIPDLKFACN